MLPHLLLEARLSLECIARDFAFLAKWIVAALLHAILLHHTGTSHVEHALIEVHVHGDLRLSSTLCKKALLAWAWVWRGVRAGVEHCVQRVDELLTIVFFMSFGPWVSVEELCDIGCLL